MNARKLTLKSESLAELAAADLAAVVGGEATGQCTAGCTDECGPTLPDPACLTLYGSRCIY
jgi:hypothetical protein